jgi:hypothetical protein
VKLAKCRLVQSIIFDSTSSSSCSSCHPQPIQVSGINSRNIVHNSIKNCSRLQDAKFEKDSNYFQGKFKHLTRFLIRAPNSADFPGVRLRQLKREFQPFMVPYVTFFPHAALIDPPEEEDTSFGFRSSAESGLIPPDDLRGQGGSLFVFPSMNMAASMNVLTVAREQPRTHKNNNVGVEIKYRKGVAKRVDKTRNVPL